MKLRRDPKCVHCPHELRTESTVILRCSVKKTKQKLSLHLNKEYYIPHIL